MTHLDLELYNDRVKMAKDRLDNPSIFRDVIAGAINILGYTEIDIARKFKCSIPTVSRWINGEAVPYERMRLSIYDHLLDDMVCIMSDVDWIKL